MPKYGKKLANFKLAHNNIHGNFLKIISLKCKNICRMSEASEVKRRIIEIKMLTPLQFHSNMKSAKIHCK